MVLGGWPERLAERLEKRLTPDSFVFEWGPGDSTKWFAQHSGFVVTVEHDEEWYRRLMTSLEGAEFVDDGDPAWGTRVYVHLVPPEKLSTSPMPQDPQYQFMSLSGGFAMSMFMAYATVIRKYPPCWDVVYLDGRARIACAREAMPKLRPGGLLVLHDANRIEYRPVERLLSGWGALNLNVGGTSTTIWEKP